MVEGAGLGGFGSYRHYYLTSSDLISMVTSNLDAPHHGDVETAYECDSKPYPGTPQVAQ